jgi:2-hydroxy-4-carboxymuconate semialdehyde hemiacetal dehydrogenase
MDVQNVSSAVEHQCPWAGALVDRPPALAPSAHTVDLFAYQTGAGSSPPRGAGSDPSRAGDRNGHVDQLKSGTGAICTLSRPSTTTARWAFFRYTATTEPTLRATTTSSTAGKRIDVWKVDVSMNSIELRDREFAAIREGRDPTRASRGCCRARILTSSSGS